MPRAAEDLLFLIIPREYRDDQLSKSVTYAVIESEATFPSGSRGRLNNFQYGRMVNSGMVVGESRVCVRRFSKDLWTPSKSPV